MTPLRLLPCLAVLLVGCGTTAPRPSPLTVWPEVAAAREAVRSQDPNDAVRRLRALLDREPGLREVRRELGLLQEAAGDPEAETVLAPLVATVPVDPPVVLALARLALRRADPATAARRLAILAASPGDVGVEAYLVQAEIARLRGDPEAAENALRQALILDPGHPGALLALARIANDRPDPGERDEVLEALRRSCPGHPALRR